MEHHQRALLLLQLALLGLLGRGLTEERLPGWLGEVQHSTGARGGDEGSCRAERRTELWGGVVPGGAGPDNVCSSATECCSKCQRTQREVFNQSPCNVWVYCSQKEDCGDSFQHCWLKRQEHPEMPAIRAKGAGVGWTSGTVFDRNLFESLQALEGHVVIKTELGEIRIQLRPHWAPKAVAYVRGVAAGNECEGRCNFYRAERMWDTPFGPPYALVQGSLRGPSFPKDGLPREGAPVVQRGFACIIGEGPDFFVSLAEHSEWGNGHTVFGEVKDMRAVDKIAEQPTTHQTWGQTAVTPLARKIPFTIRLE